MITLAAGEQMTQTARLQRVYLVAVINAALALGVAALVLYGLRAARAQPQPPVLSCPAQREPDPQLTQTLQLIAAEQQTLLLRALQADRAQAAPAQAQPAAAQPVPPAPAQAGQPAPQRKRQARRARAIRPGCRLPKS